jgi:N-acyl amino acid synthase FeeM
MSVARRAIKPSRPFERGIEFPNHVDYRLAESDEEKDAIYRLRYRAYRHEGAIGPIGNHRLIDRFDDAPNCWTFGVYVDGSLAGSLRISLATPDNADTPAVDAFGDLLGPELAKGKTIVDPNRFVADPQRGQRIPKLPYMTLRLAYVACAHFGADIGTATVRKEHQAFYRRVFLHESLCPPRPYPTLTKPLCLMAVDYPAMCEKVFQRYPFFRSTAAERRMLFGRRGDRYRIPPGLSASEPTSSIPQA